jgi:hypothetical protein
MKTSELTGRALNYAVAIANGIPAEEIYIPAKWMGDALFRRTRDEDGNLDGGYITGPDLLFSRKWEAGGPIIERERMDVDYNPAEKMWRTRRSRTSDSATSFGPTPLIAAMRCYVASKLGDEVDIPERL